MIDMYCKMIEEQFAPLLAELRVRDQDLKKQVEIAVKKDLGIYNLFEEKAKLELQLSEIKRQLKYWEDREHGPFGYKTPVEERVDVVMNKSKNGINQEVTKAMNDLIYKVKLSGLDDDIKSVFDDLPEVVKNLSKKIDKLPAPSAKKLLR